MQARAIFGAAVEAGRTAPSKKFPVAEIMVPLVASVGEFKIIKQIIDKTAAAIQKEDPSFPRENMEKKNRKNMKKKVELVVSNLSTFWNQLSVTIIIPSASSAFYSLISSRRT
jgi:hypothetical protein